jgi:hypothetical protein
MGVAGFGDKLFLREKKIAKNDKRQFTVNINQAHSPPTQFSKRLKKGK